MTKVIDLTAESDDTNSMPIELISDSEDEDLTKAIAMSLQDQNVPASAAEAQVVNTQYQQIPPLQASGLGALDRKAMEAERLARLKRKRELEEDHETEFVSRSRQVSPPVRKRAAPEQKISSALSSKRTTALSTSPSNPFDFSYPKVLLTSHPSKHTASSLTSTSFRDVISAPRPGFNLKSVLMSSFVADFDWLLPHFNTQDTSFVIVLHAQNAEHRRLLQSDFAGVPNVRLVLPQCMGGSGSMHSKVMLLFFKSDRASENSELCRIVITSANLTPTDWGVGSLMENVVLTIDVPKKKDTNESIETHFERSFKQQLRAMEVPEKVLQKLDAFDLRATEEIRFVSSISQSLLISPQPGQESQTTGPKGFLTSTKTKNVLEMPTDQGQNLGADKARVGLLALSDAVSALGLTVSQSDPAFPLRLDFITSSLGNLSSAFIRQLYSAACGSLDPDTVAATKSRSKKSVTDNEEQNIQDLIRRNLRIYFPSEKTVRESKGGPTSAGTICFQRKWWQDNDIIRDCLYDCTSSRDNGILMHSKILYVRFARPKTVSDKNGTSRAYAGYVYVGSGNLSESAWGRVTFDTKIKKSKMTCRNWESGVVIPIHVNNSAERVNVPQTTPNSHSQIVEVVNPASLMEAKYLQADRESRLDNSRDFKGLSLNDTFSPVVPVPIKDSQRLVDNGLEPWFFRD